MKGVVGKEVIALISSSFMILVRLRLGPQLKINNFTYKYTANPRRHSEIMRSTRYLLTKSAHFIEPLNVLKGFEHR